MTSYSDAPLTPKELGVDRGQITFHPWLQVCLYVCQYVSMCPWVALSVLLSVSVSVQSHCL